MRKKRYKNALIRKANEERAFEQSQTQLKEKHGISRDNVIVVEKANTFKFTVKSLAALIRLIAAIIMVILAVIGLAALIYPGPRQELSIIFLESFKQVFLFLELK